jgi:hypothetical protein
VTLGSCPKCHALMLRDIRLSSPGTDGLRTLPVSVCACVRVCVCACVRVCVCACACRQFEQRVCKYACHVKDVEGMHVMSKDVKGRAYNRCHLVSLHLLPYTHIQRESEAQTQTKDRHRRKTIGLPSTKQA